MNAENSFLRLKRMLKSDKQIPHGLNEALASDIGETMRGYFDYDNTNLNLETFLNAEGKYIVKIELLADRVKNLKVL